MQMFDTISDYVTQNLIDWSIMSNRAKTNKDLISTFWEIMLIDKNKQTNRQTQVKI